MTSRGSWLGGMLAALLLLLISSVYVAVRAASPPVAVSDGYSTLEEIPISFKPLENDFDPDGDSIRLQSYTQPFFGSVTCSSLSGCTYTPKKDFVGDDAFQYTISSVDGTSTTQVGIEVNDVNDPPIARDDFAETLEDKSVTINILANDSDIEGDTIRLLRHGNSSHGTVTCTETACTYKPNSDFHGEDSFTYNIADHRGGGDSAIVHITVIEVSEPPKPADDEVTMLQNETVTIAILDNDVEPDGDPIIFAGFTQAENGFVECIVPAPDDENQETRCIYTPNTGFFGDDSFSYTIEDDNGLSATATVLIHVVKPNEPPVAEANGPYSCEEGATIMLSSEGSNDPDGTITSFEWSHGVMGPGPQYLCESAGTHTVTLVVTDDAGDSASDLAEINVAVPNQPPVVSINGPYECLEGEVISLSSAGSSDPDGSITGYDWSFGSTDANPSYTCGAEGVVNVSLTITDDDGASATATTSITISPQPNELPIADAGGPYSCEVGETLVLSGLGSRDPDGSIVSYQWSFGSTEPMPTFACASEGVINISLVVMDDSGASANDATSISISEPANEAPVAISGGPYSCQPGETITLSGLGSYDLDGEIVSYEWSFGSTSPTPQYACGSAGTLSYSLTVYDDRGDMATQSFSITVIDDSSWDKSSLRFLGNASVSCVDGHVVIRATIQNGGDKDMNGPSEFEVWHATKGNPKNGQMMGTGEVPAMQAGQSAIIEFTASQAGNYKFKAYQRPGHPGIGMLWSATASVSNNTCN